MASLDVKQVAADLKALPFFGEVDAEALLGQFRDISKSSGSADINHDALHTAFKALGIDKPIEETPAEGEDGDGKEDGGDDGGKEAEGGDGEGEGDGDKPAKEVKYTDNAAALFSVVDTAGKGVVHASDFLATLRLCTAGWSEDTLKAIITGFDLTSKGAVTEHELNAAINWAAPEPTTFQQRTHLRKAWRGAEKWQPEEKEEEDGEDEDGEAQPESKEEEGPTEPEPSRVLIEDFLDKVREDEYLAAALLQEKPVPSDPVEGEDEEDE